MKNAHLAPVVLIMAVIVGCTIGLTIFQFTGPPSFAPSAPTPAVAPADRDLVVGLSEVLVDVHREATAARKECESVKKEARQIINAMVREIQRLQKRPRVNPTDGKVCETN